jgi:hypothetical protein
VGCGRAHQCTAVPGHASLRATDSDCDRRREDNEKTFSDLISRVRKTIDYLNTLTPAQIDGSEERAITLQMRNNTLTLQGLPYLLNRVLPNFYFHVTTAYDILRHNGVELGKQDYLGKQ